MYLVVSTSLNPDSRSRRVARHVVGLLDKLVDTVELLDVIAYDLPIDKGTPSSDPAARQVAQQIGQATGILIVLPIYHSEVSIAARNLVQLSGSAWQRKVVGFVSVAGEAIGHASTLSFANSLMLEHRCFVIPDFVFIESNSLSGGLWASRGKWVKQLDRLTDNLVRVTESLRHA